MRELPVGAEWQYEPKWDGFRGVLENLEGELALWSRNGRPLLRYFPELAPLGELLPPRSALDGEVVIVRGGALDFDAMQMRLHPAESRIRRLAAETPAVFVAFDLLLWDGAEIWERPLRERRAELERRVRGFRLSPATLDPAVARGWLDRFESLGLDGVVAKRLDLPYRPGSREAVVKVKEHRSADCVVVGVRWKGAREAIATLLLGLYRDDGGIDYVGSCAVAARSRAEVAARILPLLAAAPERRFSEPNRWGSGELEQAAVRPELVVEVRYDKVQGNRFRHGTKLLRWRPDKDPHDCTWRELKPLRAEGAGESRRCSKAPEAHEAGASGGPPAQRGRRRGLLGKRRGAVAARRVEPERGETRPQRYRAPPHALHRVAGLREPIAHRLDREERRIDVADLVPAQRRRDPGVRRRAHRVGAGDRPVTRVLAEVDEDPLAVGDPPGRRRDSPDRRSVARPLRPAPWRTAAPPGTEARG